MRLARLLLGAVGVGVATYGAWLLLGRGPEQLWSAATWLAAGVVAHDLLLAPLVLVLGLAGVRLLPRPARGPCAAALVVLGSVTLVAVPVLGRFGARPDNPTLLDREYGAGWALLATLVLLVTAVAVARNVRRSRR